MNSVELIKMLKICLKSNVVPFIQGSPGIGKSDIVRSIANKANLQVIDVRLSQCDPSDLLGFPKLTGAKAEYLPMAQFPIEGDTVPEGCNGWLLFLN